MTYWYYDIYNNHESKSGTGSMKVRLILQLWCHDT